MKFRVLIFGCVAAAAIMAQPPGGPGPRGRGPMGFGPGGPEGGRGPQQTVTGAPYSGVEVHSFQQVLANGNVIQHQESVNVSRDTLGRVRRESTRQTPDGKTVTRISISDPVAGVFHELDAANKIAFERPMHQPGPNRGLDGANGASPRSRGQASAVRPTPAADPNIKHETLSAQSINGILASGSRVTRTIPVGQVGNTQAIQTVHETWMIDDLKVPVQTKMTDPRNGTTTMALTNINRNQPDASLFAVPSDYTVKKGGPGGGPGGPGRGPRGPGGPGGQFNKQ
jgi:hypothetical protein